MNKLFPGRADYTGPDKGYFGLLHHDQLFENSEDVMERVSYVKSKKPKHEIATRLHNMIYLYPALVPAIAKLVLLDADYEAMRTLLYADYEAMRTLRYADYEAKLVPLDADYYAKRTPLDAEILAYIKTEIPDCSWDGRELVFNKE